MSKRIYILVGLAFLLLAPLAVAAELVVIANDSVPVDSIGAGDLQKIFLGRMSVWSNGSAINPVVLDDGEGSDEFLRSYVKKTPSQFSAFWKKAMFTGTGTPPETFDDDTDIIAYVASTPGAVGFVSATTAPEGVKVLTVE